MNLHDQFRRWLLDGGRDPVPREPASHAVICLECTGLARGMAALKELDFPAAPVPAPSPVPAPPVSRRVPAFGHYAAAAAVVLLAGGMVIGAGMLASNVGLRLPVDAPPSLSNGDVLANRGTPRSSGDATSSSSQVSASDDASASSGPRIRASGRPLTAPSGEPTVRATARREDSRVSGTLTLPVRATAAPTTSSSSGGSEPGDGDAAPPPAGEPTPTPLPARTAPPPAPTPTPARTSAPPSPTPSPAVLTVADASAQEGDVTPTQVSFTVSLSRTMSTPVTVSYSTANGTAVAPADYVPALPGSQVTIQPGQRTATIAIAVVAEKVHEQNEDFVLTISTSSPGVTVDDGRARGTIIDDDGPPLGALVYG